MQPSVKKILSLFVIAVFAAGAVLPLVWCVNGSGHSVVEFKINGGENHPSANPTDPAHERILAAASWVDQHFEDCVDRDAVPPAVTAYKSDENPVYAADSSEPRIGRIFHLAAFPIRLKSTDNRPPCIGLHSLQLAQLRTVVLLI